MKLETIQIGSFKIDVTTDNCMPDRLECVMLGRRELMGEIERTCAMALGRNGNVGKFEIQTTPRMEHAETGEVIPAKLRLLHVLGEWDW